MRIIITLIILCLHTCISICQKNDYIWQMGSAGLPNTDSSNWFTPFQYNFNYDPMRLEFLPTREWDFRGTSSAFSSDEGKLMAYSNNMFIIDSTHQWMKSGEVIGYNTYWEFLKSKIGNTNEYWYIGYITPQGNVFVPYPDHEDQVFHIGIKYNFNKDITDSLIYAVIDFSKNNGLGEVIIKDQVILDAEIKEGGIAVTRHANGRDWWMIIESDDNASFYIFLIDAKGINLHDTYKINRMLKGISFGTNTFSLQGDKYASISGLYWLLNTQISLFDFDRSSGKLSNEKFDRIPSSSYEGSFGFGVIFSNDGRYLYTNNNEKLYKYDLHEDNFPDNRSLLAEFDGYISYCVADSTYCPETTFGFWQYGPDGKLYNVSDYGGSRHMHRMEYPDEEGTDCQFTQHAVYTPNNPWTIPNFPNFRLGPLDGSIADTLGLDNNPIAKFRYEQDTTDHLSVRFTDVSYFRPEKWSWDFGDNTTFDGKKPYWHSFPHNGTYNVCLTVSNENSSNTICRSITIGPSSIDHELTMDKVVSIFPNPTDGYLLMNISEYIPEHGEVFIYDMQGRLAIKQKIYYGWNNIDMTALSQGTYLYKVTDKKIKIGEGKIVKI